MKLVFNAVAAVAADAVVLSIQYALNGELSPYVAIGVTCGIAAVFAKGCVKEWRAERLAKAEEHAPKIGLGG